MVTSLTDRAQSLIKDRTVALFFIIFALVVLAHLPGLTTMPAVNHDEAAINAAVRSWTHTGVVSLTLLADDGNSYGRAYYWHPPGHLVAMAAAYKVFGFSVFTTRGETLFFGALATALFFLVARKISGSPPAGVIAAMFLAGHPLWWWLCRSGRTDTGAIAFGLGAILLWLYRPAETVSPARAAGVGLLLGLGSLFHVLLLTWTPVLLVADLIAHRRMRWRAYTVCAFAAAVPLAAWVADVFARGDGDAWIEQFWKYQILQRKASMPLLLRPWAEFHLFLDKVKFIPLFALAVLAGAVLGWRRIEPVTRRWCAGSLGVSLFLVTFGMDKGPGAYPMYWFAWLAILSAAGWAAVLAPAAGAGLRRWRCLLAGGLVNAVALHLFWAGVALYQSEGRSHRRVDDFFAAHVPAGSLVVGGEEVWYAVEHAGASLRIWVSPDAQRHDFYVAHAGTGEKPPAGFHFVASLPDKMPLIFGKYFSSTSNAYDLWGSDLRVPVRQP